MVPPENKLSGGTDTPEDSLPKKYTYSLLLILPAGLVSGILVKKVDMIILFLFRGVKVSSEFFNFGNFLRY